MHETCLRLFPLHLQKAHHTYQGQSVPGNMASTTGTTGNFSAAEQSDIANFWAAVANAYAPFNIIVTTVEPARAALGPSAADAQRQAWYDTQVGVEHTIITPGFNPDTFGAGGISYGGTTTLNTAYDPTNFNGGAGEGRHKNFQFTNQTGGLLYPTATVHENGHALGLAHHVNHSPTNNSNTAPTVGDGMCAPTMVIGYYAARAVRALGAVEGGTKGSTQNDMGGYLRTLSQNSPTGFLGARNRIPQHSEIHS